MDINYLTRKYSDWILQIERTGSSVLPWISDPRDMDYIILVSNTMDQEKVTSIFADKPNDECWFVMKPTPERLLKIFCYEYKFNKLLCGKQVYPEYDIFDHEDEIKKYITRDKISNIPYNPKDKKFYHILTLIYMFENGSYELTEEQQKNIKLCHDRQMTQEIYNFISEKLKEYGNPEK